MSATVVRRSYCSESLLAGGVPLYTHLERIERHSAGTADDLKFHCLSIQFDCPDFLSTYYQPNSERKKGKDSITYEVNADSRDVAFGVCVIGKS